MRMPTTAVLCVSLLVPVTALAAPPYTCCNSGGSYCANQTITCTGAQCVFNVRDFGAAGDGGIDDTQAMQCAINAASNVTNYPMGGAVYLPRGAYPISVGASLVVEDGGSGVLIIGGANVKLFGDGDSSELVVPSWQFVAPDSGYYNKLSTYLLTAAPRVQLDRFSLVGGCDAGAPNAFPNSYSLNAIQVGGASNFGMGATALTDYNSIRLVRVAGSCYGSLTLNYSGTGVTIADNAVQWSAADAINPFSGGQPDEVVSGNILVNGSGFAMEYGSAACLLVSNVVDTMANSSFSNANPDPDAGWTIFAANSMYSIGNANFEYSQGSGVAPTKTFGNVVARIAGSGDVVNGGVSGLTLESNVLDGYGSSGAAAAGYSTENGTYLVSTGNLIRCGIDAGGCVYGIGAGGSGGVDSWEDANLVLGINDGGYPFLSNLTSGYSGVGGPACGSTAAIDVRAGAIGVDLATGVDGPPSNCSNIPYVPDLRLPYGVSSISVAGWPSWGISSNSSVDGGAQIGGISGGSIGQLVHLFFDGPNPVSVLTDGGIDLRSPFTTSPNLGTNVNSTLTLLSVATVGPTQWVEVARTSGL